MNRIISPFNYNPLLPKISSVLMKHHSAMIFNNPELQKVFPEPPMAALRQGPNLRKFLCRAKLSKVSRNKKLPRNAHKDSAGWRKCSKPCPICPFSAPPQNAVKSQVNNYEHRIVSPVNCQSRNIVYMWKCRKQNCPVFPENSYIGLSTRKFQLRFSEHLGYVKSDKLTEPSGEHFNMPGHSIHDMEGIVLEAVRSNDPYVLRAREALLIQKFNSFRMGLNKEP